MSRVFVMGLLTWVLAGCGAAPQVRASPPTKAGCRDWAYDASGGVTWTLNEDEDGVQTFVGEVAGSDYFAFRGFGEVDAEIGKVANVLIDTSRHHEWVPNFGGMRIVRDVSEDEKIIYRHVTTPAVIDDRDFVVKVRIHKDDESGHLLVDFASVRDPEVPPTEDKVRGIIHAKSGYRMWPVNGGTSTMVVFTIHVDPRGDVPAWIVNIFQNGYPLNNIKNIRAQATKPDTVAHPKVREAFVGFVPKCGADKPKEAPTRVNGQE